MKDAKVAIVGSGVAGTTVADILLSRGVASHVILFEAGPRLKMMDRRIWLDFLTTGQRPYRNSVDIAAEVEGDASAFLLAGGRLMIVGGSTVHWGGWCPRMKPEDFELNTRTGQGLDWQVSYNELAPYYEKAELRMRIAGDSKRNDPPRYGRAYPVPAVPLTQMDGPVVSALEKVGFGNYGSLPIARNEKCVTTGTCRYCPVGGRYEATMDIRKITGNFTLRANSPAVEIVMKSKREASGVRYIDLATGVEQTENFDAVFVCAGSIESAKLLLASKSRFWTKGIGNDTDHVGRHLISHPRIQATGTMEANPKAYSQEVDFPTLECRHFDTPAFQKDGKLFFVRDDRETTADFAKDLVKGGKPDQMQAALLGPVKFTLSGFVEEFESPQNRVELASGKTRFGLPRTKVTYATPDKTRLAKQRHLENMDTVLKAMGIKQAAIDHLKEDNPRSDHAAATCRMSKTAATGVVARDLRVHDCDNIYVCSNAVFPNLGAVNPTVTLVALAIRAAESA